MDKKPSLNQTLRLCWNIVGNTALWLVLGTSLIPSLTHRKIDLQQETCSCTDRHKSHRLVGPERVRALNVCWVTKQTQPFAGQWDKTETVPAPGWLIHSSASKSRYCHCSPASLGGWGKGITSSRPTLQHREALCQNRKFEMQLSGRALDLHAPNRYSVQLRWGWGRASGIEVKFVSERARSLSGHSAAILTVSRRLPRSPVAFLKWHPELSVC